MAGEKRPRVVDFSAHTAGPLTAQLLVQFGADVIKIENPRPGVGHRSMPPLFNGHGVFHYALAAGTRSLAFDRRSPEWPRLVQSCARWADAVLVGLRPSDARERGIDFEGMVAANPRLVYCLISGFGEEGPWRDYPAHGLNMDALAGLLPVDWSDGSGSGKLQPNYLPVGTTLAGAFGALGVMAALYERERTGEAQFVDLSIWGSAMWWNWRNLMTHANLGDAWLPFKDVGARYCAYRTADGRALLVAPIERKFWESLCDLLDLPAEWKARGSWERGSDSGKAYEDEERRELAKRFALKPLAEWITLLEPANIPFSPLFDWRESLESDHARLTGVMTSTSLDGKSVPIPASPVTVRSRREMTAPATRDEGLAPPPELGEHNEQILQELGLLDLVTP